jgi:CRISPR/Cas system-associated endonuclease Cas1
MSHKLMGQGKLVRHRFGDEATAETIGNLALAIESAATVDELRQLEASAAALYPLRAVDGEGDLDSA